MQYTVSINQVKALEWGLNAQQALLFAFIYECPSWANPIESINGTFYAVSKQKITEELPLLTDKPDTAYRLLKQLQTAGLIELSSTSKITLVRLTEKAKCWNKKHDGSEIYPKKKRGNKSEVGNKSVLDRKNIRGEVGKISDARSDKSPTNQYTSNQDTNNQNSNGAEAPDDHPAKTKSAKSKIPFQKIADLFNSILPELPAVVLINKSRESAIRSRWNEHPAHQSLEFWEDLFNDVRKSDFLMGRAISERAFRCSFDWIIKPSNFVKVVEGNYIG